MDVSDFWFYRIILSRAGGGYSGVRFFNDFRHDRYLPVWFSGLLLVEASEPDAVPW